MRDLRSGGRTIDYHIPRIINRNEIAVARSAANPTLPRLAPDLSLWRNEFKRAATAGYSVAMTYIALNDVERNVWRVTERTAIDMRRWHSLRRA